MDEEIIIRTKILFSWASLGASIFLLIGYIGKIIPAFQLGVWALFGIANLFILYLFYFYPHLREECGVAMVVEILGGLLLWM